MRLVNGIAVGTCGLNLMSIQSNKIMTLRHYTSSSEIFTISYEWYLVLFYGGSVVDDNVISFNILEPGISEPPSIFWEWGVEI